MKKRYKMTVDIPVKLHEETKELAKMEEMTVSGLVCQLLELDISDTKELENKTNKVFIWRALAIAFFVAILLCIAFLWRINNNYIKLFNEGVPVSEDVSMVQYYKAIIANKCKIEAR